MSLTRSELRILELVAQGKNNKQIASELAIAQQTVKNALHMIFIKLDVTNRTQAALKAIKEKRI